jgi:hypothetical protein
VPTAGVDDAPSNRVSDLFLQFFAKHLVHAVLSLWHLHWERGLSEHTVWRLHEQQVRSRGYLSC